MPGTATLFRCGFASTTKPGVLAALVPIMDIDLSKPLDLPAEFIERLHRIESLCKRYEFSEELVESLEVSALVRDIDQYCNENRVIGVHYTRALPESISANGLLVRDGEEIRREFLRQHGHRFSEARLTRSKKGGVNTLTVARALQEMVGFSLTSLRWSLVRVVRSICLVYMAVSR